MTEDTKSYREEGREGRRKREGKGESGRASKATLENITIKVTDTGRTPQREPRRQISMVILWKKTKNK